MIHRDIIVVGASAGGVEALQRLVSRLPADFRGSLFVTVHFPGHGTSTLPRILSRAGPLSAVHPANDEAILPGRVYVAPPDFHLLFARNHIRLARGPRENRNRPAVDPMFRSAAIEYGPRVIGVVLTGNLDDGTAGLRAIKRYGGLGVVQDPADALFPSMPLSALDHVKVDRVATLTDLPGVLLELSSMPITKPQVSIMNDDVRENAFAAADLKVMEESDKHPGEVSAYSCPDCGGVLWEIKDGEFARFRCRVGHAWTGEALLAEKSDGVDDALWEALRALEESAALARQM
jgi:two-component system, chemotaxis family, protein-glutamate methylesterase/glutaminase